MSTANTGFAPGPSLGVRELTRGGGRRALWALPALLAAGYLVVMLVDYHAVISAINTYGDAIVAPVLGKLAGQAPAGSQIVLGHHPYYEEYLFLRATAGLPFYRGLWEVAPMVWTLVGFGVLGWAAWRALGAFAALLTVPAVICLGNHGRFSFFTLDWHGVTVLHTILVAAALVWLAPRAARISWPRLTLAAIGLGLISALPAASDQLFWIWALVPMCLVATVMAFRGEGRARWTPPAFALGTTLVALGGGVVITHVMQSSGVVTNPFHYPLIAPGSGILHNLKLLPEGLTALGGGYINGVSGTVVGIAVFISGLLILAALVCAVIEGGRVSARSVTRASRGGTSTTTLAFVGFWLVSLLVQLIVFILSGVPRVTLGSSRYILAGYVAIMALVPLLAARGPRWRAALTVAVSALAASALFQLARQPAVQYAPYPTAPIAARLSAFARAHDVHYGYAGYWDAPDLTWLTHFRLLIYPINADCGRLGICRWHGARITSWYQPRPGTRSMMIVDSIQPQVNRLDRRLGRPLATAHIGTLTVAVYPFDLARVMTPARVAAGT